MYMYVTVLEKEPIGIAHIICTCTIAYVHVCHGGVQFLFFNAV